MGWLAHPEVESEVRRKVGAASSARLRAPLGGPQGCWMCFSAACCVLRSDLPRGSLGPGPDTRGPSQGARPQCTSGRSPGSAPAAPPPSPNFLPTSRPAQLGASLCFPHELFSSARSNQRAPAPTPSPGWGRGELPRPPRAPPSPARRRPAQSQPGPAPARPTPRRSLPPSRSVPARLPPSRPARCALGPAARAATLQGGGETASGRPTPSQLGRDPEVPEGPRLQPRLALRPPVAAGAKTPPARLRARRGRGATPGRRRPVPVRGAPAWARAEGPDRESRVGSRRLPSQGGSDLGGLVPPKLGSDPIRKRLRHGTPGSALLGFARRRLRR